MGVVEDLKAGLSTATTGYAAVIGGVMDIRTIRPSRNEAAYPALIVCSQSLVITNCGDPECDYLVRLLAERFPDVRIVEVKIEAME